MRVDLDGILEVTAIEKRTGLSRRITIANALRAKTPEEIAAGRKRIQELYEGRRASVEGSAVEESEAAAAAATAANVIPIAAGMSVPRADAETESLLERSRRLLGSMHAEDREDAIALHERILGAVESGDKEAVRRGCAELRDLLFFFEGGVVIDGGVAG
jgi:hypothetical protein